MNIQQMMKQAQQMQRKIQENQNKLESTEFEGVSGNGFVKIKSMGNRKVKSISIDNSLLNIEEKDILEDLLIVAFNDLNDKISKAGNDSMNDATGGLNLNNMKLPF
ncbi:MAG TPA: YbaB/EbfC family nucleoid-associated protein [Rickettsiales bacterium]|nr:YbaB/EbfC family nucleoid-associated protein [Rickettsiales bacterium]